MKTIISILLIALPVFASAKEVILDAPANNGSQLKMKETYSTAEFSGSLVIKSHESKATYPTRVVIGIYEETPKTHSFQILLERIGDTEEYWLAYLYLYNRKPQIRIDIQSGIKLNQKIPFNLFFHPGGRLQVSTFETTHYPYTKLKSKTPFVRIDSGSVLVNYEYKEIYWKESAPPVSQ